MGKILNALDFPQHHSSNPPTSLASELFAFRAVAFQGESDGYPTTDVRWGIAATQGAFSSFHIDSDGLGTYISCVNRNGSKWWVIVGPKDKSDTSAFASVREAYAFHNGDGADTAALGDVQVEAVLLRPGTRLCAPLLVYSEMLSLTRIFSYMRPNTPHAVLTPDAAICHGGHYLSTSNLRSTCYGFLMGFALSTLLTNTNHTSECQLLFCKMLAYYYHVYTGGRPNDAGTTKASLTWSWTLFQMKIIFLYLYLYFLSFQGPWNRLFPMCLIHQRSTAYMIYFRCVILSRWQTSSTQRATNRKALVFLKDKI